MVHLLSGIVPRATFRMPKMVLSVDECAAAVAALKEAEPIIAVKAPLADALTALSDKKNARDAKKVFLESCDAYRLALQGHTISDPLRRLDLHQVFMASQFYSRAVDMHSSGDARDVLLQHYKFDIKRDRIITKAVHQAVIEHKETTKESEDVLTSVLLLERKLFGGNRLHMKQGGGGEQWLCLGVQLKEITAEPELDRVLNLPVIKAHGNFIKTYDDPDPELKDAHKLRWKSAILSCGPETTETVDPIVHSNEKEYQWELKILKPAPPVPFWGRVRQKLLEIWVIFFAFWATFFLIDEEIITFIGLIYTKYKQTQLMKEEAKKAGGQKVYITRNRGF